ncbi:hypothetical protein DL238_08590 [Alteriqipengyuania lutimaris]|uniref:Uncharacterized protein n=2 Tax=Alteriqipengyuania lutimaris TaxID=1538146 RepID=A0A395LKW4_9SPHN|nr:hypothetical protein DL238_08590 [Alteriqipengyuania lutimaris]
MIHALRSDMDSVINTYQAFSDKIQKGDLRDHFLLEQLFPFSYAAIALVTLIMTRHDCVLPLLS